MRTFLQHARLAVELSTARLPAAGVVVVGSFLVFTESAATSRWLGHAHDTGMYLSVLSFAIAGSLFAISGYHTAARGLVGAPELRRSTRSGADVVGLRVTGDLAWLLTGLLVVHAAAYLRTAGHAGGLEAHGWSLSLLGLCSASACYGLGLVLGAIIKHVLGLFPVAVLPYGLTLLAGEVAFSPASRFQHLVGPFVDQSWGALYLPNHAAVGLLAAYSACAAAALVAVSAHTVRTATFARRGLVAMPLLGVLATGTVLAAFVPGTSFYHPRAASYECDPEHVVCVRDVLGGSRLDDWRDAEATVRDALGSSADPRLKFTEAGVPVDGYVALALPTSRVTGAHLAALMLEQYVNRLVTACSDEREAMVARVELLETITPMLEDPDPERTEDTVDRIVSGC